MKFVGMLLILTLFGCQSSDDSRPPVSIKWTVLQGLNLADQKITTQGLKDIVNKKISIRGFAIPLEFKDKKVTEFLLAPYFPSCMHVPPPPPNQAIHIKLTSGVDYESLYAPIKVTGNLLVVTGDRVDSGFRIESPEIQPTENQ